MQELVHLIHAVRVWCRSGICAGKIGEASTFTDSLHCADLLAILHGVQGKVDGGNRLLGLNCPHRIIEVGRIKPRRELISLFLVHDG